MNKTYRIFYLLCIIIIITAGCAKPMSPDTKKVAFNRLSLVIPNGWNYSTNPQAKPGTDQIQLYSPDRNRTLLVTLTDARKDKDLVVVTLEGGRELASRAVSVPEFSDCLVEGSGQDPTLWGRTGIVTAFQLVKETASGEKKAVMKIYNFGESLEKTNEVLFIGAFIVGEENDEIEKIVKSMEFLPKKK
jgi:hypothetical protein